MPIYNSKISSRARGFEQEHDFIIDGSNLFTLEEITPLIGKYILPSVPSDYKLYLLNGAAIYEDVGLMEMCIPTYTNVRDAVLYEKSLEIYSAIVKYLFEEKHGKKLKIYKSNVGLSEDGDWVSHGTHRSICVYRSKFRDLNDMLNKLLPFFVSRILLVGSGGIYKNTFNISPRTQFISTVYNVDTVFKKPIFNTRNFVGYIIDEITRRKIYGYPRNYSDPQKFYRLHDINFEGLRSHYNIFIADGLFSLVIQCYEEGFLKERYKIKDPIKQIKRLSSDKEFSWEIEVENGKKIGALEILNDLLYDCENMLNNTIKGEEDKILLREVESTLKILDEGRIEELNYKLDWVTKFLLLSEVDFLDGIEVKRSNIETLKLQRAFEEINYNSFRELPSNKISENVSYEEGIYNPEKSIGKIEFLIPNYKEELYKRLYRPPEDTRDYFIINLLKAFPDFVERLSWDIIIFKGKLINISNPLDFNKSFLEEKKIQIKEIDAKKVEFIMDNKKIEGIEGILKITGLV